MPFQNKTATPKTLLPSGLEARVGRNSIRLMGEGGVTPRGLVDGWTRGEARDRVLAGLMLLK